MEQHTPILATSQKLKAAGFSQKTYFLWMIWNEPRLITTEESKTYAMDKFEHCAAPILTEILEQLPSPYEITDSHPEYGKYLARCFSLHIGMGGDTPVEAAALLWLKLNKAV
jgi:hypothetical protein